MAFFKNYSKKTVSSATVEKKIFILTSKDLQKSSELAKICSCVHCKKNTVQGDTLWGKNTWLDQNLIKLQNLADQGANDTEGTIN